MTNWTTAPLDTIAQVIDCKHRTPEYAIEGIPLVAPGNISWGQLRLDGCKNVTLSDYQSLMDHCQVDIGDLVVGRNQSFGVAAYVADLQPFALGQDTVLIKPKQCVPRYLYFLFQSVYVQDQINLLSAGSTFKRINLGELRKISILLPPVPEQRKIAAILSTWDEAITLTERLIEALRQRKQALMQLLLTGAVRFKEFGGEEWPEYRLGDVGRCIRGVSYDPETDLRSRTDPGVVRLLRASNISSGLISLDDIYYVASELCSDQQMLRTNDIAICMASGSKDIVGKAAMFNSKDDYSYTVGAFCAIFRGIDPVTSRYIGQLLQTNLYRSKLTKITAGSSINNLKGSDLEALEFALPDEMRERERIVSAFENSDRIISVYAEYLNQLFKGKRSLMQRLLTGAIRVQVDN